MAKNFEKSPAFFRSTSALSFFEESLNADSAVEALNASVSIDSELDAILAK